MKKISQRALISAQLAVGLVFGASSFAVNAAIVATWPDPGTASFSFVDTGTNGDGVGELTASSSGLIVDVPQLGIFTNASYTLTDSSGNPLATTSQQDSSGVIIATFEAGILTITTDSAQHGLNGGDTVLTGTFDAATGVFGNVLSADSITGQNVTFTGPALGGLIASNESFSFSAANIDPGSALISPADMEDWTATTSFTSSATLVPVPAAVWLFGSGLLGLVGIARRRRS